MIDRHLLKEDGGSLLKEDGGALLLDSVPVVVVFPTLPPTLESVLMGHHTPVVRLQFLAADLETVLHEVVARPTLDAPNEVLLDGSVSKDRSRDTHASADVRLANPDGLYSPLTPASLTWPNAPVRIARGALVGDVPLYADVLTGIIEQPEQMEASGEVRLSIASRLSLADRPFPIPLALSAGMRVRDAIRLLAEVGGLGTTDAWYSLDDGGLTLAEVRTFDSGDQVLRQMMRLAFDAGLDLYDDATGVLVLAPFPDLATQPTAWTFEPGEQSTATAMRRRLQSIAIYNRVVVVGIAPDRYPIRAEARVTNPDDPLYWTPEFDLVRPPYVSSNISTQAMANATAQRLLIESALYEEDVGAESVPIPLISDRDVVALRGAVINDRYLVDRMVLPLGQGRQQISSRKVRSLVAP